MLLESNDSTAADDEILNFNIIDEFCLILFALT